MSSWYYDDGRGNAVGPFDDDQLRDLVRQGTVGPTSHVHRAGTTAWVPLSAVAAELGLAATTAPGAMPPPPPGAYTGFPGAAPAPPPGYNLMGATNYSSGGPGFSPNGRMLASWGSRVGAWIIDALIVLLPLNILLAAADLRAFRVDRISRVGRSDTFEFHFGAGGFLLSILVGILYYGLQNGAGQTVGKRVASIRVVDATTGSRIGSARGIWRYLFGYVLTLACAIPGLLDVLWPLWDQRRQALHDKVVNSVVERTT